MSCVSYNVHLSNREENNIFEATRLTNPENIIYFRIKLFSLFMFVATNIIVT
jgi:hypothetical protein